MRKRISSVLAGLLAALLLWGLAPVTAEAAGASFSGSGSVRAGDSVTVTFTVSGSNIQGITAVLHYDSSALTLTGTRQLVGSSWSVDMSGGNLLAYDQSLSNPITGSAAVLAVTFQVKSGVAAGTRVSATITDIVATDGNSDQSLNDASWAASVAAPPSGNANLAGLSCGDYALSPAFSAGTTEYSVTVPYDVSRLPLDYRAADGGADVSVSGNQLSVGVNTVVLTVTAANGASRRYTISVTRQPDPNVTLSSDASLSELTPSTGQLSPAFSPEITEYAVYVPYETSKISLSATAKDSKALGVTQPDASLKEGDNLLTVTCTAEDGATRDYTVHVVRMPAFAGTLPQIGQPEPEDPSPEEPQTQTGPFRALWTALCAPVDLPLNRWLPMYAILAAGLVILLVLLFFIGRAVGIARSRRRLPDHPAQMEPPQSPAEPESVPETPESVPEPVPEPEEAPAASEETPVPPVIVPESVPAEEAPAPEAVTPPEEEVPAEEPEAPVSEEVPAEPEPVPEPEPTPQTPEEAPEEPEDKPQTLDRDSLDALLEEIRNMEPLLYTENEAPVFAQLKRGPLSRLCKFHGRPGADLPDLGLQALQVLEGLRLLARVPQQGRRVIQGCHPHAVFLKKLPVFLGDLKIRPDDLRRADASQAHQDLRLHQLQLPPQKSGAGVLFGVQRVPVFGRAALDAVGDVDFLPPQADHGQHIVQQLPGGSHKGLALLVLAGPGGLAHQQHLRRGGPHPEHHVGPGIRQAAGPAAHALLPQLLPLVHIFPPFPRLCPGIAAALPGQNEGEGRRRRVLAVAVLSV